MNSSDSSWAATRDRRASATDALVALQDVLRLEGILGRPATLLPGTGYGLPQFEEREALTRGEQPASRAVATAEWPAAQ